MSARSSNPEIRAGRSSSMCQLDPCSGRDWGAGRHKTSVTFRFVTMYGVWILGEGSPYVSCPGDMAFSAPPT
jgi:hypothetical protein